MKLLIYTIACFICVLFLCFLALAYWAIQEPPDYPIPVTDYRVVEEAHEQAEESLDIIDDAWRLRAKVTASVYAWETGKGF